MEFSINDYVKRPKEITYWRNPTREEIRFGYGATHFRDFEFEKCLDENGIQKLKIRATDDKLIY